MPSCLSGQHRQPEFYNSWFVCCICICIWCLCKEGEIICKKKKRRKGASTNPATCIIGSVNSCLHSEIELHLSLAKGKKLVCFADLVVFCSVSSCTPFASRTFWLMLPANFGSSLAWHSLKPGNVSSDFWGHWFHPGFLTLTTETCYRASWLYLIFSP